jgi:hypothetical protein
MMKEERILRIISSKIQPQMKTCKINHHRHLKNHKSNANQHYRNKPKDKISLMMPKDKTQNTLYGIIISPIICSLIKHKIRSMKEKKIKMAYHMAKG